MYTRSRVNFISDSLLNFFIEKEKLPKWKDIELSISKFGIENIFDSVVLPDVILKEIFRDNEFLLRMIPHLKFHHHYLIKIAVKDVYFPNENTTKQ